jgi:DNA-binding LacI/PurR family transcriptional regulator
MAHLTGPRHHGNMTDRVNGFVRALKSAAPAVRPTILYGENSFSGGYQLAQNLFEQDPEVTAIFAASDVMAFGVLRAIVESGRRIPDDVSLIGFDNVEFSSVVYPPLTTIHQPKKEIGQAAVEILLRLAKTREKPIPEHRLLGVELVERQSCRKLS